MSTYAERFINEARDLMPYQSDLLSLSNELDSPADISDFLAQKGDYLSGMGTVILALLAREDARLH